MNYNLIKESLKGEPVCENLSQSTTVLVSENSESYKG